MKESSNRKSARATLAMLAIVGALGAYGAEEGSIASTGSVAFERAGGAVGWRDAQEAAVDLPATARRADVLWHARDLLHDQTAVPALDSTLRRHHPYPD